MMATDLDGMRVTTSTDGRSFGDGLNALPDDVWMRILQTGVESGQLKCRDLCTLAIVSNGMKQSCESDVLWKELVAQEFPESVKAKESCSAETGSAEARWKGRYILRYKKVRAKKMAAQRRQVLLLISSLRALQQEVRLLTKTLAQERESLYTVQREVRRLDSSRRSSVALQIWQPQAVSTRHQQVVEQAPVDLEARINSMRNFERECKVRIQCSENAVRKKALAIQSRLADLDSLLYTPARPGGADYLSSEIPDALRSGMAASAIREYTSKFLRRKGIDLDELRKDKVSA